MKLWVAPLEKEPESCISLSLTNYFSSFPFLLLFFGGSRESTGVWTHALALARQVLYHLSHTYNPFVYYFSDRICLFVCFFPRASLGHSPLLVPSEWLGLPHKLPCSPCLLWWNLTNFFPGLTFNHDPLNLHLLSGWDYRWCFTLIWCLYYRMSGDWTKGGSNIFLGQDLWLPSVKRGWGALICTKAHVEPQ
jgi:hypothetical protein